MSRLTLMGLIVLFVPGVASAQDQPTPALAGKKAEAASQADPDIEGKWERSLRTKEGVYRIVKEHKQHRTRVQVFDEAGALIQEKTSRYDTKTTGDVRIFTFFDSKYVNSETPGQVDPRETSYIYRVDNGQFHEVHGILRNDKRPVTVIVWKRVYDSKSP